MQNLHIVPGDSYPVHSKDFIARFQAFVFSRALGADARDIAVLADHLHLPAIIHAKASGRRNEECMVVVQRLKHSGDRLVGFSYAGCMPELFVGLAHARIKIYSLKLGIVVMFFHVFGDIAQHLPGQPASVVVKFLCL